MDSIPGFTRKRFKWNVTLQQQTGAIVETVFQSYWSPNFEGVADLVSLSAAAKAWFESCPHDASKRIGHAPIAAALVTE